MNPCELSLSITALANVIACQFDDDTLDLLSAVFSQLGDTLGTISTQRSLCSKSDSNIDAKSQKSTDSAEKG